MYAFKKIVLAGGSGHIGTVLCDYFKDKAEEIIILSRGEEAVSGNTRIVKWDGKNAGDWYKELEGADVLVNLTGRNINCRFTEKNKNEILESRVDSVKALSLAITRSTAPPKLWIQCASTGIYDESREHATTESDDEAGDDFLAVVCKRWEKTFREYTFHFKDTRRVILRNSMVLGKKNGAFPRLEKLVRIGLGGKQGTGLQWMSWIHEEDLAGIVEWVISHPDLEGVINCSSPQPLQNKDFMRILRETMRVAIGIPSPTWFLKMGAFVIGTDSGLILKSSWVLPERILKEGYVFRYGNLEKAVKEIVL